MTMLLQRPTETLYFHRAHHFTFPRILCVDDDPDFQVAIELCMKKYLVEIQPAYYGVQGIVEASRSMPDLILMDLAMPHGNGEYLLDVIKRNEQTADIPVIVLTGMRDNQMKRRLMRIGAAQYLTKPLRLDDLVHEISRFVDLQERESR